jgi:hypothetical protein
MKKPKVKIIKFREEPNNVYELNVKGDGFEIGYIDDINSYLNVKLGLINENLGCCSLSEMKRRLKQLSARLNKDINNINNIVEKIEDIKRSEHYKKIKKINKKT